jgi:hypothetical protein
MCIHTFRWFHGNKWIILFKNHQMINFCKKTFNPNQLMICPFLSNQVMHFWMLILRSFSTKPILIQLGFHRSSPWQKWDWTQLEIKFITSNGICMAFLFIHLFYGWFGGWTFQMFKMKLVFTPFNLKYVPIQVNINLFDVSMCSQMDIR